MDNPYLASSFNTNIRIDGFYNTVSVFLLDDIDRFSIIQRLNDPSKIYEYYRYK